MNQTPDRKRKRGYTEPKSPDVVKNSAHELTSRRSAVNSDWDKHMGTAIEAFSPKFLPTVRAVLRRYRYLRTENPTGKSSNLASEIAKEVKLLWQRAGIPHFENPLMIYNEILKWINLWTSTSRRPANRSKSAFQNSLDILLDIRPKALHSMDALEKHLKKSRNDNWQEDVRFFQGQLQVS